MTEVPQWAVRGDWFDVCSCDIPCPCEFARPPTSNHCQGVLAYHVREGHYGDVPLDGLNLVALGEFEGNVWAGAQVSMALYLDDRADEAQQAALGAVFGGQAGGWPAKFAAMVGDSRGVEIAPVHVEVADDLSGWHAEVPGRVSAAGEALTGPTTPPGARVQLLNPPGSEVGPGQTATWGVATANRVSAENFTFAWEWGGRSSKHIPFDWSGPDT
ncbi:DUF1326 domain-containing protein [Rhodococcus daqingensis]|uniref:DUF1326 domain-containing protein n=1 Tax=Rhodococcus daqingensis TaxID=2479363 RepID=A0ABW2RTG7_9NOCA